MIVFSFYFYHRQELDFASLKKCIRNFVIVWLGFLNVSSILPAKRFYCKLKSISVSHASNYVRIDQNYCFNWRLNGSSGKRVVKPRKSRRDVVACSVPTKINAGHFDASVFIVARSTNTLLFNKHTTRWLIASRNQMDVLMGIPMLIIVRANLRNAAG